MWDFRNEPSVQAFLLGAFASFFHHFLMIVVWNARGAAGKAFNQALKELKRHWKPKVVVLLETRCSGENAQRAIKRMSFKA